MGLSWYDITIVFLYLVLVLFIGFYLSTRASKNLESYFLGGYRIRWYFLGLSNASGMFDISGSMWTVTIAFVYGLKSAWIPWLWPVWNQIFVMVFLAIWMRRSGALTGAEWITFRFGEGKGGRRAHVIVVIFAVVSVIGCGGSCRNWGSSLFCCLRRTGGWRGGCGRGWIGTSGWMCRRRSCAWGTRTPCWGSIRWGWRRRSGSRWRNMRVEGRVRWTGWR